MNTPVWCGTTWHIEFARHGVVARWRAFTVVSAAGGHVGSGMLSLRPEKNSTPVLAVSHWMGLAVYVGFLYTRKLGLVSLYLSRLIQKVFFCWPVFC